VWKNDLVEGTHMTKDLTSGNPFKIILLFTLPLMLGNLFQQFYSLADTIIVGRFVGVNALAAVGATGSVNYLILGFVIGLCNGFAIPIAQLFGAHDDSDLRRHVANATWLCIAWGVVLTVVTVALTRPIMELMQTPADIIDGASTYIGWIFAGIPFVFLYNMVSAIMRALGDSKTPLYFLVLTSAVNIVLDLVLAVTMAIVLNELHQKKTAKVFQTVFMAPYFLSWVVVSFIAYSFLSVDNGFINRTFGLDVTWYSQKSAWPVILIVFQIWKTLGYSTVMYLGSIVGISNDYYEAALMDGATKWQQIKYITLPSLKSMMIVLTILAIGKIFYADFGLFYQLPRNSGPLFPVTNVIDTYVYRSLKENGNIGMAAAANLYQSLIGFVLVLSSNFVVRKIDKDSALF